MPLLYQSNFDSDTLGAVPPGWVGIWKVREYGAVSGANSMAAWGEVLGERGKYTGIAARTVVEYRIKQRAIFHGADLLLEDYYHAAGSTASDITDCYRFQLPASASSVTANLSRCISSIWDSSQVASQSHSWEVAADDIICFKIQIDGTSVKFFVWNSSNESEPTTPLISYTDSAARPAGYLAVGLNNGGGTTSTYFDDVSIYDAPQSAGGGTDGTASGATLTSTATLATSPATGSAGGVNGSAPATTLTGTASLSTSPATGGASGSFSSSPMENNAGTLLASTVVLWEWRQGAGIGVAPTSVTYGVDMTNGGGVLTVASLPVGAGELLAATADYANVYYERGTVS